MRAREDGDTASAALHPDVQTKARKELDRVVGRETDVRRPTAFMLNAFRWRLVSVGGFTHRATREVVWSGYRIPKGAAVIANHFPSNYSLPIQSVETDG
ncbi:hypothetical protein CONPUDRAFT_156634 [Coniophora puteana RWD-64-598 SS2]|uniref:Uncharacterized protein n=1 Tax=Coniophora puteana (strain RWD-64-598) TaxID=741705 RepID=A0A5M3MHG1_CONPW|nr:uncharacterized protein CONPUDRAFT_156634 [Coniophora puteana RWD-64-598 SS2]EIW78668.1 hypothetical protein CONPUDRAFT_156634 [Coniophora puteana RWD-64-598 SS2]